MAGDDPDPRCDAVPQAEDGGRLDRRTQGRLERAQNDRDPEVVQAQGQPEPEQRDHFALPCPGFERDRPRVVLAAGWLTFGSSLGDKVGNEPNSAGNRGSTAMSSANGRSELD